MITHDMLLRGGDLVSAGVAVASLASILPVMAAGLSVAWYLWRFYKEPEFQPKVDAFLVALKLKRGKDEGSTKG